MLVHEYINKYPLVFLQIAGWGCYIIIDILGHAHAGYYLYGQSIAYGTAAFVLTSCVALLSQKHKSPNTIYQLLYFVFLLYLAMILWSKLYRVIHDQGGDPLSTRVAQLFDNSLLQWLDTGFMPVFLFLAWGGFYVATKWYLAYQEKKKELDRALLMTKQAQLETLRYQLNPHFLFNVLNSVDVSVSNGDTTAARNMIKYLSSFLRNSLMEGESSKITLDKEFELIRNFISIEQLRFGDALKLQVELDDICKNSLIPPMLLQPLVENAIKYAWSQKERGSVSIFAAKEAQTLRIVVRNNKAKEALVHGTGTGLKNTRERLKLAYGSDASISISDGGADFDVEISIPWEVHI